MAANSSVVLSSLDFDSLKLNFKEFLKAQTTFKDYNFDGSNMNVLLDVMSYNSYLNSFYLNMVASEMFLDSAQKYDSIVSHAKELNYIPRSTKSSSAELSLVISTSGLNGNMTVPKGTKFTGFSSNNSYTFTTNEAAVYVSANDTFTIPLMRIYEGDYYKDSYVVDNDIENQQFLITNKNIDTDSLTVNVIENNGATNTEFKQVYTLYSLGSNSSVFFLQGALNDSYEIVFGDGLFGRKPLNGATVVANYRVSSGEETNGISSFSMNDNLGILNGGNDSDVVSLTVLSSADGGAEKEDIESVRFAAPRYFATQQRAVSSDDYASLILENFGGEITDVVVYGGQEVEPKLYGRVIVSLKPKNALIASNYIKNKIESYMTEYITLPTRIVLSNPDYLNVYVSSVVQFDSTTTVKTASEIETIVRSNISLYSSNNLEKFGNDLRYSRMVSSIDNSDTSITSNDTEIKIIKKISPILNTSDSITIAFDQELYYDSALYYTTAQHTALHTTEIEARFEHSTIFSSKFTYNADDLVSYPLSFFEDDGNGIINVYTTIAESVVQVGTAGTVDYATGLVKLNNINIGSYDTYISIYAKGHNKDIFAIRNKIIIIDPNDVSVTVQETLR